MKTLNAKLYETVCVCVCTCVCVREKEQGNETWKTSTLLRGQIHTQVKCMYERDNQV